MCVNITLKSLDSSIDFVDLNLRCHSKVFNNHKVILPLFKISHYDLMLDGGRKNFDHKN